MSYHQYTHYDLEAGQKAVHNCGQWDPFTGYLCDVLELLPDDKVKVRYTHDNWDAKLDDFGMPSYLERTIDRFRIRPVGDLYTPVAINPIK